MVTMAAQEVKRRGISAIQIRVSLSEAQARAGLVRRGTADDLMAELNDVRKSGMN